MGLGDFRWKPLAGAVDDDGGAPQQAELLGDVEDRRAGLVHSDVRDGQCGEHDGQVRRKFHEVSGPLQTGFIDCATVITDGDESSAKSDKY